VTDWHRPNPDSDCDEWGVPWYGTTDKASRHYFSSAGVTLLFNGTPFYGGKVIAFHRKEGWLRVRPWKGGAPFKIHGTVEVFRGFDFNVTGGVQ
jgi:hypothetical protein